MHMHDQLENIQKLMRFVRFVRCSFKTNSKINETYEICEIYKTTRKMTINHILRKIFRACIYDLFILSLDCYGSATMVYQIF